MSHPSVAIIFINYGPYHIARIEYFSELYRGKLFPIELSKKEKLREWVARSGRVKILSVQEEPLEDSSDSKLCKSLIALLREINPAVLVIAGYSHSAMRAAARWGRKCGAVNIIMSDTQHQDRKRVWFKEKLKGWWVRRHFDAALVGGQRSACYLNWLGFPRDSIWGGYDVVDNEYFSRCAHEVRRDGVAYRLRLKLPERYFLYVGRFSPEKNLPRLLKAYKKYKDASGKDSWGMVLVGSGPQEDDLKRLASSLSLDDVLFTGYKQIDELPTYYALASCFVLPSVSETWGLVVNEAMACGLPILASNRCGCVPELVHAGINGYTFEPDSIDSMTYFMMRVSSGKVDLGEMGEASKRIIANYTPYSWARALADCIDVTLERRKMGR